ncbi:MAG: hypothetical protein KME07_06485 [Pegethrix bostrychoides GSE-TBD4-15B]|jgi:hypothetical protein|uniref:Uncharacterized protein n=1 Tax=Pegethrix bostrychoides GSE-TBD4-15B TaxID=2839662 RepID=A0A951P998_9CYAN|nr:hypothetical protein [Pegethrix bostrychoides GSE-TBD4-15B]
MEVYLKLTFDELRRLLDFLKATDGAESAWAAGILFERSAEAVRGEFQFVARLGLHFYPEFQQFRAASEPEAEREVAESKQIFGEAFEAELLDFARRQTE